ncbi:autotransporter outer membrane beta-barrel domain-containing protein [Desulfovibrio sp. OttesenSCG-928-G15]|nr:autotransporter outer membrane beta-barrel domain-containing protein [Desulfovibrio sp. OttesenSCG-928-G15]
MSISGNTVNIGNGASATDVYGGWGDTVGANTVDITVSNNHIVNNGGTLAKSYGGYAFINMMGVNSTGIVSDNTVTHKSGHITGNVAGGYALLGGIDTASPHNHISVTGNHVYIDGTTKVDGDIYGGLIYIYPALASSNPIVASVTDNSVTISGSPDLSATTLYGGRITVSGTPLSGAINTGNTLNLKTSNLTVAGLENYQNLNFYVPETLAANGKMLIVTGTADITGTTVKVGMNGNNSPLVKGDSITLIDASAGSLISTGYTANGAPSALGIQGITKAYTFDVALDPTGKILQAEVTKIVDQSGGDTGGDTGGETGGDTGSDTGGDTGGDTGVDTGGDTGGDISSHFRAQLKSLAEARISGVGMLTQGADLLARQGIPQLRLNAANTSGPAMFGVMGGQSLRYNSGSHVDVDGFNLVTGLGWNFALTEGRRGNLLFGAFFESGWGSYDSHNSFSSGSVKGDGDTKYYGGGILARYDSPLIGPGKLYTEASFRAGKVETDYSSSNFLNSSFTGKVDYDSSSAYYGAHAGIGYIWNISEASNLDMYTKYLWTRQGSDSVTIEGDSIRFKAMNSHRWRAGAKFSHAFATDSGMAFTPYFGAAYEREFDSKARATANGKSIDAPAIKGGTGIGELGFSFKPSAKSGLSLGLGMQGYTGKREGVGGSFQVKFEF